MSHAPSQRSFAPVLERRRVATERVDPALGTQVTGRSCPGLRLLGWANNAPCSARWFCATLSSMMFGDAFRPADATTSTTWIDQSCRGDWGTVGGLVPNHYDSVLQVDAPDPGPGDWWSSYSDLYAVVAAIGERHTSTPGRAWFAIWEGHGFDNVSTRIAWPNAPLDDAERRARDLERQRRGEEDRRRNAAIRDELDRTPRFHRPERAYYLLIAPVDAVTELRYPDAGDWRNPDLFWPDDRRWFVATDVDFWSLYIGGSSGFVDEIAERVPTRAVPVDLDVALEIEE